MYRLSYLIPIAALLGPIAAQSQTMPDFNVPTGTAMVCQFDHQVTKIAETKAEKAIDYYAIISRKSAQLCVGDDEGCKRFENVGKNDGGSIIFVSSDGLKMTTNVLALSLGAGVSVEDLRRTISTTYTGQCHNAEIATVMKSIPYYEE
jgi:hypothetical protein